MSFEPGPTLPRRLGVGERVSDGVLRDRVPSVTALLVRLLYKRWPSHVC